VVREHETLELGAVEILEMKRLHVLGWAYRSPIQQSNNNVGAPDRVPLFCASGSVRGSDFEAHTFRLLQIGNDLKQVIGSRIPIRAKHLVKSL